MTGTQFMTMDEFNSLEDETKKLTGNTSEFGLHEVETNSLEYFCDADDGDHCCGNCGRCPFADSY